jgi:hypothetical protein
LNAQARNGRVWASASSDGSVICEPGPRTSTLHPHFRRGSSCRPRRRPPAWAATASSLVPGNGSDDDLLPQEDEVDGQDRRQRVDAHAETPNRDGRHQREALLAGQHFQSRHFQSRPRPHVHGPHGRRFRARRTRSESPAGVGAEGPENARDGAEIVERSDLWGPSTRIARADDPVSPRCRLASHGSGGRHPLGSTT